MAEFTETIAKSNTARAAYDFARETDPEQQRRRAIRDLQDALERSQADLVFEICDLIRDGVVADASPLLRAVRRAVRDRDWPTRRAWRAFLQAFAP